MCHKHSFCFHHRTSNSHLQGKAGCNLLLLQIVVALCPHTSIHSYTLLQTCMPSENNFPCSLQVCSMIWNKTDGEVNCCLSAQHIDRGFWCSYTYHKHSSYLTHHMT